MIIIYVLWFAFVAILLKAAFGLEG